MKTKMSILMLALIAFFGVSTTSCQQKEKETDVIDKIGSEIAAARSNFNDLKEDDPQFSKKLENKLDSLEQNLSALNEEMEQTAYKSNKKLRLALNDLQQEGKELKNKVAQWSQDTGEEAGELKEEIKADFNDFKESIKNWEYND